MRFESTLKDWFLAVGLLGCYVAPRLVQSHCVVNHPHRVRIVFGLFSFGVSVFDLCDFVFRCFVLFYVCLFVCLVFLREWERERHRREATKERTLDTTHKTPHVGHTTEYTRHGTRHGVTQDTAWRDTRHRQQHGGTQDAEQRMQDAIHRSRDTGHNAAGHGTHKTENDTRHVMGPRRPRG